MVYWRQKGMIYVLLCPFRFHGREAQVPHESGAWKAAEEGIRMRCWKRLLPPC